MNLAKVLIAGNLTRDPETRVTPSGLAVCSIGVAVNRTWKNKDGEQQQETTYVDASCFDKPAEMVAKHWSKGKPIFFEGRLKTDSWTNQAGENRSKLTVVIEGYPQFVGKRDDQPDSKVAPTSMQQHERETGSGQVPDDEDIPF